MVVDLPEQQDGDKAAEQDDVSTEGVQQLAKKGVEQQVEEDDHQPAGEGVNQPAEDYIQEYEEDTAAIDASILVGAVDPDLSYSSCDGDDEYEELIGQQCEEDEAEESDDDAAEESGDDPAEFDVPIESPDFEEEIDPLLESGSEFCGWTDDDSERVGNETLQRVSLLDPHHCITAVVALTELKVWELKKELKARGLPTSGLKSELINRLQDGLKRPGELNDDETRVQAGEFDSHPESGEEEDIGIIMERKMNKIKPEVEERRKKIWDLLEAGVGTKDICTQLGCKEWAVWKVAKMQSGGKAAKFNFMRKQISQLLESKIELKEICRIVGCSPRTVYRVSRLKGKGQSIEPQYKGTPRRIRTEEFIEGIWSLRCSNPGMPMKQMAKHVEVSETTTRRAVREDLCLYSYKHRVTHLVPKHKRPVRVRRGQKLLDWREKNPEKIIIYSDEKQWVVDSKQNRQNDRYLAYCVEDVPEKHCTTKPSGAMMLGVCASDGKVMPPLWIDKGAKVDSKVYIELLKKVKAWIDETYGDTPVVFQQDGAPSHVSEETQAWMDKNFHEYWTWEMWPPYSPDLNPLDYNVWGYVESRACKNPHSSVSALQKSVDKSWAELLTEEHVKKTCAVFWDRVRKMIKARGCPFEK